MRVLMVSGDKQLVNTFQRDCGVAQFEVQDAPDGEVGLKMVSGDQFDMIVLDWVLPKMDGLSVLKKLREQNELTPILMLTSADSVVEVVRSLDSGANTCVPKPPENRVLIAKMKALLRRSKWSRGPEIQYAHIRLDPIDHRVWSRNKEIKLTDKEYSLLLYFMQRPEQVVTHAMIAKNVWDNEFHPFSNIIIVYMNYLRKKLDKDSDVKLIHTVRGTGYVFRADGPIASCTPQVSYHEQ